MSVAGWRSCHPVIVYPASPCPALLHLPDIHYLRWARHRAADAEIPLTLSGMEPPADASWAESIPGLELVGADATDTPPLAHELAQSWDVAVDNVLLQPGSHWSMLLMVAARLARHPGPVVVEQPAYEPLVRLPEVLGRRMLRLPRPLPGAALDLEALEALAAEKPSLLLISQPHNPTGAMLSATEAEALARWSQQTGCALLSDEVYLEFLADPEGQSLLSRVPGCASVRSFTKALGLAGLRCSAVVGPSEWVGAAAALSDYGPVHLPGPAQAVARRAWSRRDQLRRRAREASDRGRAMLTPWLAQNADLLEGGVPPSGLVAFLRPHSAVATRAVARARGEGVDGPFGFGLDRFEGGAHEWIEGLRRRRGVLVTPGAFFEEPAAFRLGLGLDPSRLQRGLSLLADYLRGN